MPGEEIIQESVEVNTSKHSEKNAYQKLFYLFRFRRKEKSSSKARKQSSPDERRDQLERDMRNNWDELPTTLKRRKEKMSQAVLAEFHSEHDQSKSGEEQRNSSENSSPTLSSSGPGSFFVEDKELTEISLIDSDQPFPGKPSEDQNVKECEEKSELSSNSSIITESNNVDTQHPIDVPTKDIQDEVSTLLPPGCSFSAALAAEELDLKELKQLKDNLHQALSTATEMEGTTLDREQKDVIKLLTHAVSEDSLLIESSSASERSSSSSSSSCEDERLHHDSGTDVNSPSSSSSGCEESPDCGPGFSQVNGHFEAEVISKPMPVEDPIICSLQPERTSPNLKTTLREFPSVGDSGIDAGNDVSVPSSPRSSKALTSSTDESNTLSSNYVDLSTYEDVGSVMIPRVEYQGKDKGRGISKTAEEDAMSYYDSVVQESQNYDKKTDVRGSANNEDQVEISISEIDRNKTDTCKEYISMDVSQKLLGVSSDSLQDSEDFCIKNGLVKKQVGMDLLTAENISTQIVEIGDKMRKPSVVATKWKRPMCMETLNKKPKTMATIIEEPSTEIDDTSGTKLTVREILRRFELLGGRMPPPGDGEEKSATLREIQETLRCLEEKVRLYEDKLAAQSEEETKLQQKAVPRISSDNFQHSAQLKASSNNAMIESWTGRIPQQQAVPQTALPGPQVLQPHPNPQQQQQHQHQHQHQQHHNHHQQHQHQQHLHEAPESPGQHDGKHSLLQFAMLHFRQSPEKFEMLKTADGSISGSLKVIESLKSKKNKGKKGNKENDWTWKEQVDLVKFTPVPIENSLLRLESGELNELAVECFLSVMRYMGDAPMAPDITEVKCVYTILMHCHKHESLRDEVYCQLMKQTTNNKSSKPDSCQRGWRLFSIIAAYFVCSDTLKPYLYKYLETAAYDKRRAYHGTATVCLQNLRKTFKYGGRKNVPSVEEITAISAGRNSKRQIYRLPGGTERVINTKSTTVVQDVIEEICSVINVQSPHEMEEFSLYCIVEGDTFTMPLAREEYILDVTTELHKNQQVFYLIFCRSVWHFPLRLDSHLYIEVVFNQIAPDYLEGLLLVMPGEQLDQDVIYDIAKMAALLHRAADMQHLPSMKETKFLLPKPALTVRDVKPAQWVNMVQSNWREVEGLQTIQAKAQVLDILSKWPLFGSSFFAVKRVSDPKERSDHILALNRHGVHFLDLVTHETLIHYPFSEVISTRKVKSEDGTLFLDMKCGNLMQQRITRLQTDQAHEISRLIRQYITMEQRLRS